MFRGSIITGRLNKTGNMRKSVVYLLILLSVLPVSCGTQRYNKVYSYKDEFRGGEKAYTRIRVKPEESRTEAGWARIIIERQAKGGIINIYFIINRSVSSFRADQSAYLKAGDRKFGLVIRDRESELRTKSEAASSGVVLVDSLGVASGQSVDIDSRSWIEEKFMIKLGKEEAEAIVSGGVLLFRFYFGPFPVTYCISGRKFAAVIKVLKAQWDD